MNSIYIWSLSTFLTTFSGAVLILIRQEWARKNVWRILAFASGILLGVAFMQILPEAHLYAPKSAGLGMAFSLFLIFSIEHFTMIHSCAECTEESRNHIIGWLAFGALTFHSLLDGMAITASFQKNSFLGGSVSFAVLIHKLTDGLTLTGLLISSQFSRRKSLWIVTLLALATPLGSFLSIPLFHHISDSTFGTLLGFVAGTFFYIGAADILPQIHKVKDRICLILFALGLFLGGIHLE